MLGILEAEARGGAAEPRRALDQHDLEAGRGGVERRVQPGDAAADHQHPALVGFLIGDRGLALDRLGEAHAQLILGHGLGLGIAGGMAPGDLLSDIDALDRGPGKGEHVGVDPLRAGGDDHRLDSAVGHVAADQRGVVETERGRGPDDGRGKLGLGDLRQALGRHALADAATRTDVNAEFPGHRACPLAAVWIAPIAFIATAAASWTAVATSTGPRAQPAA